MLVQHNMHSVTTKKAKSKQDGAIKTNNGNFALPGVPIHKEILIFSFSHFLNHLYFDRKSNIFECFFLEATLQISWNGLKLNPLFDHFLTATSETKKCPDSTKKSTLCSLCVIFFKKGGK